MRIIKCKTNIYSVLFFSSHFVTFRCLLRIFFFFFFPFFFVSLFILESYRTSIQSSAWKEKAPCISLKLDAFQTENQEEQQIVYNTHICFNLLVSFRFSFFFLKASFKFEICVCIIAMRTHFESATNDFLFECGDFTTCDWKYNRLLCGKMPILWNWYENLESFERIHIK